MILDVSCIRAQPLLWWLCNCAIHGGGSSVAWHCGWLNIWRYQCRPLKLMNDAVVEIYRALCWCRVFLQDDGADVLWWWWWPCRWWRWDACGLNGDDAADMCEIMVIGVWGGLNLWDRVVDVAWRRMWCGEVCGVKIGRWWVVCGVVGWMIVEKWSLGQFFFFYRFF